MLVFGLPKKPFYLFGHSAINLSLLKFIREFFLKTLSAFQTTLIADFSFFFWRYQHDICINPNPQTMVVFMQETLKLSIQH